MRSAKKIIKSVEFDIHFYGNSSRRQLVEDIDEAMKEAAVAFFKWQRNNYSSQPNEEELEERYDLFIQSNNQQ